MEKVREIIIPLGIKSILVIPEAERIRTSIKNHKFKSLKHKGGITVSIGISYSPHPEVQTHDDLISFADNALFEAKNSGRDKVIICK